MNMISTADFAADDDLKSRDPVRITCNCLANVRPDGLRNVQVRLCDISEAGFMAECAERVALGSMIAIDLPGLGATHARVRWNMGGRIGARFVTPIDLAHCRAAIARETGTD